MTARSFPGGIRQEIRIEGYQEAEPDVVLEMETDAGESKRRPLDDEGPARLKCSQVYTTEELRILRDWWRDDLAMGALDFERQHPIFQTPATVVFRSPLTWSALEGDWLVTFDWEISS